MSVPIGRMLSPGPVFVYEWITAARRWQGYALRSLFVLFLLAALGAIWISRDPIRGPSTLRGLAHLGEQFFVAVVGTQLTLVLLAAPAATAGAICLDRARGTLAHVLVTDLTDGEIVLGKLAARLTPVLGLVLCTLPVMELLTLLGGVDPDALLGAFLVTLGIAVLGCCLALVFSLWAGRTHEALLGTYAVWGLWLLAVPMINQFRWMMGWSPVPTLRTAHPYLLAFAPYWWPGSVGWSDYFGFLGVTWGISAALAGWAVWRMRAVCTRDVVRRRGFATRKKKPSTEKILGDFEKWGSSAGKTTSRLPRNGSTVANTARLLSRLLGWPSPTLDFNPVLWREWHRNRPARWARIVAGLFIVLAATFSLMAMVPGGRGEMAAWVNALQVSIGLLLLSVTAATSLAEERVRGSLDMLLTTPLTTRQIVMGKWLGTFRLVPFLAALPALVVFGEVARSGRWLGIILMIAYVLASGAAITSLGLAMATWCSRLGRAVGLTVALYVLVAVGWLFLAAAMSRGPRDEGLLMGSPFFWAGVITSDLGQPAQTQHLDWAILWLLAGALAAVALLAAALATFNRCLGRVDSPGRFGRDVLGSWLGIGAEEEAGPPHEAMPTAAFLREEGCPKPQR